LTGRFTLHQFPHIVEQVAATSSPRSLQPVTAAALTHFATCGADCVVTAADSVGEPRSLTAGLHLLCSSRPIRAGPVYVCCCCLHAAAGRLNFRATRIEGFRIACCVGPAARKLFENAQPFPSRPARGPHRILHAMRRSSCVGDWADQNQGGPVRGFGPKLLEGCPMWRALFLAVGLYLLLLGVQCLGVDRFVLTLSLMAAA